MALVPINPEKDIEDTSSDEENFSLCRSDFEENFDERQLFSKMFGNDKEAYVFKKIHRGEDLIETFKSDFASVCQEMAQVSFVEKSVRNEEILHFVTLSEDARHSNKMAAIDEINQFFTYQEKIIKDILSLHFRADAAANETLNILTKEFTNELNSFSVVLTNNENRLVDQINDLFENFEINIKKMTGTFIKTMYIYINKLYELEDKYIKDLEASGFEYFAFRDTMKQKEIEKTPLSQEEDDLAKFYGDINGFLSVLLRNKEMFLKILQTCHTKHTNALQKTEIALVHKIHSWLAEMVEKLRTKNKAQHRKRVMEINYFLDYLNDRIDNILGFPAVDDFSL